MAKNGIITVCQVDHYEPAGSGGSLFVNVFYKGKVYKNIANASCSDCNGKYFFVRIMKGSPTGKIIFFEFDPVPDCILKKKIPDEGWSTIPKCD
jgi:hypothetical protein